MWYSEWTVFTSVLNSENKQTYLALLMAWGSGAPEGKCFNVLLNMLCFTESQWWIFVFPMLWKDAVVINLDIQLDRIDRCHGLVKHNSGYFHEAISREYWHLRYQWRRENLLWKWLHHPRVLMWKEGAIITLDKDNSILTWMRLSSSLRNFITS